MINYINYINYISSIASVVVVVPLPETFLVEDPFNYIISSIAQVVVVIPLPDNYHCVNIMIKLMTNINKDLKTCSHLSKVH